MENTSKNIAENLDIQACEAFFQKRAVEKGTTLESEIQAYVSRANELGAPMGIKVVDTHFKSTELFCTAEYDNWIDLSYWLRQVDPTLSEEEAEDIVSAADTDL